MRRITLTLLLGLCLLAPSLFASHEMGADITYECISACTTRVYLKVYRDCTGSSMIGNTMNWSPQTPGCSPPGPVTAWSTQVVVEVSPLCPTAVTGCTVPGAPINGVQEYSWHRDYNTCTASPCTFALEWGDCCRNPIITSLANPGSQSIMNIGTLINTSSSVCNNSPEFTNIPMFYACSGTDYDFHLGAYDSDGDSLSYALSTCYSTSGTPVVYNTGYSQAAPLGSSWNVSIDAQTGLLHLDANPGNVEVGVLCILVSEWRNGVLIGRLQRDMQIAILNCSANDNPIVGAPTNVTGGASASAYLVSVPVAGVPFCFDLPTSDLNTGQNLELFWSNPGISATFTDATNNTILDTVSGTSSAPPTGRFCWTPTANGVYHVRFRVNDDFCPVEGYEDRVITIVVGTCGGSSASATLGTCPTVNFSAYTCMGGVLTYSWSGAGGLSGTTATLTHTYAGAGSYPWQVIISNGTSADTIIDTVDNTLPAPNTLFSGIHYVAPCTGSLYDTLSVGTWSSYLWSTGATTPELPVFIGGNYAVTVSGSNGCSFTDNTQLFWSSPDIYGVVTTSAAAPLQNQKIMLIEHDTLAQALWAADSTWTDSLGYYFFCNVTDTLVFLKATPSAFDYPTQMPTYADTTLFWNNAITFYPLTQIPFQHNFSTLLGTNPGGPGFIGGLISQGANKTGAVGDPMPGVRVFLRDQNTGNILGNRVTDANGYFSFAGIPLGDYEIVPDRPLVSTTNVPQLSLTSLQPTMDSLDFQMHRYWLELVLHPTSVDPVVKGITIFAHPNPFRGSTQIRLELPSDTEVAWEAFDIRGQRVGSSGSQLLREGVHQYSIGEDLKPGIYMVRIHAGASEKVLKVVKVAE